jgi:putative serine protease PepD
MRYPRHLWSGSWRTDSEAAEEELARRRGGRFDSGDEDPDLPAGEHSSASTSASGRPRVPAIFAVVVGMLIAGAFAAGSLIGKDDSSTKPLPAVASRPINPRQGQTRTGAIYAKSVPAVVSIRTSAGSGTGFLIDNTHTIVTNAHVVAASKHVTVRFGANGTDLDGQVLGVDASSDLAVVHLQPGSAPKSAKPLPLADSRSNSNMAAAAIISSTSTLRRWACGREGASISAARRASGKTVTESTARWRCRTLRWHFHDLTRTRRRSPGCNTRRISRNDSRCSSGNSTCWMARRHLTPEACG